MDYKDSVSCTSGSKAPFSPSEDQQDFANLSDQSQVNNSSIDYDVDDIDTMVPDFNN
jgi:hypothetical protein